MSDETPNPGSAAAVAQGCTCPVIDNAHGEGAPWIDGDVVWWLCETCPMHGQILLSAAGHLPAGGD